MSPRKKLCGLLASGTFFFLSAYILIVSKSADLEAVLRAFFLAGVGAVITGTIGYHIGKMIESPPARKHSSFDESDNNSDLIINDVLINDIKNLNNSN